MPEPSDAVLLETPPAADEPTAYDWQHRICYLRLLDADASGADWREAARLIMQLDPDREPGRAYAAWHSHLERARWMTASGYRNYLGLDHAAADE